MTNITIRRVEGDEMMEMFYLLLGYAFRASPPLQSRENWLPLQKNSYEATFLVLFEDDKPVVSAAYHPMTQNVRGHIYSTGGVWGVSTLPQARRQGYARQIMSALLNTMREADVAFSLLYPFRESFYERLGYTTFPQPRIAKFNPATLAPLLKYDFPGKVELYTLAEGIAEYRAYLQRRQAHIHGMGLFGQWSEAYLKEMNNRWVALAKVDGQMVGAMLYFIEKLGGPMPVIRFYYDHSVAKYLLLEWLARHADQVAEVELQLPPYEQPETWLADLHPKLEPFDPPMGRILNIQQIGGMQVGSGQFSAHIRDPFCNWNEGLYQFESVDGLLKVTPTDRADCELTIQAISALVFGTHTPADFALRGWGNPSPATIATMHQLFPPILPYAHERF
ncbi:MAG: GNAT family N-acetyltransferase [Chloroflexi bacterium]|nr:GNAT family N-acetyltransferase [Chloroflexota bacterium]